MTKLCKDCKYIELKDGSYDFATCASPKQPMVPNPSYLVTGEREPFQRRWAYCTTQRSAGEDGCGLEGKWFEPHPDLVDQEPPDQYNRAADAESQL